jgi:hypothetical protein
MKTQTLVGRYAAEIKGVIECFDRVVLFGTYKAIGWTGAMAQHLHGRGISFMEFNKSYANELRLEVADHVRTLARTDGIEIRQVNYGERKEAIVEEILATRGRHEGVVCILGAMERCRCFKVGKNQKTGFLQLQWSPGKCQHFYVYFIDAEFGLCHLRLPTWAPFRLQFCCNGHDWLERQMKQAGLRFEKADNCFTHVSDFAAAQALLKKFAPQRLHQMLDRMAAACTGACIKPSGVPTLCSRTTGCCRSFTARSCAQRRSKWAARTFTVSWGRSRAPTARPNSAAGCKPSCKARA